MHSSVICMNHHHSLTTHTYDYLILPGRRFGPGQFQVSSLAQQKHSNPSPGRTGVLPELGEIPVNTQTMLHLSWPAVGLKGPVGLVTWRQERGAGGHGRQPTAALDGQRLTADVLPGQDDSCCLRGTSCPSSHQEKTFCISCQPCHRVPVYWCGLVHCITITAGKNPHWIHSARTVTHSNQQTTHSGAALVTLIISCQPCHGVPVC